MKLFVAEPQIGKPITMNWDDRGRLWVAETVDYPNELQPAGEGRDRISIVEDTDGDGKADKVTVFADKLSIPTSLMLRQRRRHRAPGADTLFLKDADGDGKADERKVLFTGWRTDDTHAGPSNLRYGLDNWIYGIVGYSGFSGEVGGERHNFRQGFFRFKPDGSKLEFLRSTNNNSWGVGFSEEGLLFGSTANGSPSVYMPIANRYYESVRGMSPSVLRNIADRTGSSRSPTRSARSTGTAASRRRPAMPSTPPAPTRAVLEPDGLRRRADRAPRRTFTLHPDGTDFHSHNAWNLLASDDEWTSPIMAEVGPDGNVWVIDWYNFIVQHNPTPAGFKTGKGSAYETPPARQDARPHLSHRRERRHAERAPKLSKDDPRDCVATLKNDNMFWRLHAQRLLVERGDKSVAARPRRPHRRAGRLHRPECRRGPCDLGFPRAGPFAPHRTGRRRPARRRGVRRRHERAETPVARRAARCNPGPTAASRRRGRRVARRCVGRPRPAGPPGSLPGHGRDAPHRGR